MGVCLFVFPVFLTHLHQLQTGTGKGRKMLGLLAVCLNKIVQPFIEPPPPHLAPLGALGKRSIIQRPSRAVQERERERDRKDLWLDCTSALPGMPETLSTRLYRGRTLECLVARGGAGGATTRKAHGDVANGRPKRCARTVGYYV